MIARINGIVMPVVFDGENIVIALDPSIEGDDQRVSINKAENEVVFTENTRLTKRPKRRRMKRSPINLSRIK